MTDWTTLLEACEAEPLHLSGAIQPHGYLAHLGGAEGRLLHASANLFPLLGRPAAELLGQPASGWLSGFDPRPLLARRRTGTRPHAPYALRLGGQELHAVAAASADGVLLELHPAGPLDRASIPSGSLWAAFGDCTTTEGLCALAAEEVRRITGDDRVMVYRFTEDWSGEVVAEALVPGMDGYLGLHFPASDIPQVARHLYTLNPCRLIPDVDAATVPVVGAPGAGALDLTSSDLRSVSPVHLQYLRNMEVRASFSISVLVKGRLWGLIACHHREPRVLALAQQDRCIEVAQVLALQLAAAGAMRHMQVVDAADRRIEGLLARLSGSHTVADGLLERGSELLSLVEAGGAAFLQGDRCVLVGEAPAAGQVRALADWCLADRPEGFYATDHLAGEWPAGGDLAAAASGVIAIRRPASPRRSEIRLLWFRPEAPRTVRWAGDREKGVAMVDGREVLTPRKSFEAWTQVMRQHARPWSRLELLTAQKFRSLVLRWSEA